MGKRSRLSPKEIAGVALRSDVKAGYTISQFDRSAGALDPVHLVRELERQCIELNQGKQASLEVLLLSQAQTLDSVFHVLLRQALANVSNVNHYETLMRLSFKAQAQSRAAVEAIGRLKNPQSVAFVRQANITQGPQQINNTFGACVETQVPQDSHNSPNELLEVSGNGSQRMDARTKGAAVSIDSSMEALAGINRSQNP